MENERKFLVKELPNGYEKYERINIEQIYVCYNPEIRMRKANEKCYLTIKSNGAYSRIQPEIRIPKFIYEMIRKRKMETIIRKTRYPIPYPDNLTIELDIYLEKLEKLIEAEVEFKRRKDMFDFIIPDWFGEEVTENEEYKTKNLSKRKGGLCERA